MYEHESLPPIWKEISGNPKRQHLTMLQRALDNTDFRLSVRMPTVAAPGLFKLTLSLGFYLDHWYNLEMGLHQFWLVHPTSTAQKVLKACVDQHQVIAGGGATPSLENATTLAASDGLSLLATLAMARGYHTRLRVVLCTLLGRYHPFAHAMQAVNEELI